jgi:hypothetical protein
MLSDDRIAVTVNYPSEKIDGLRSGRKVIYQDKTYRITHLDTYANPYTYVLSVQAA